MASKKLIETYKALRKKGYSKPKAMERMITFSKVSQRTKVIKSLLKEK